MNGSGKRKDRSKANACVFEEEMMIETGVITGSFGMDDPSAEEPMDLSRIKKMLGNRIGPNVLRYDLTRNEAVAFLLYEDGYSNSDVVRIMSALFGRTFLKQNVNDYRRKAQVKIDGHGAF